MTANVTVHEDLPIKRVFQTWWPLAASWLLMGVELPALSAIVARLADPEIHLAAYGGVVFPLALIIESPIIMLLAASTALSKDWASYAKLRRFMQAAGGILTALHILVAFTPLYYFVAEGMIGAPEAIIEPARWGLMLMTPWTWSIAYRRFNQGVLIRFGHSQTVSIGTVIRLAADGLLLGIGYMIGTLPGIIVATAAVAAGVVCEALYVGWVVRPVLQNELKTAPAVAEPLTMGAFFTFYTPLAMTSLMTLLALPLGSAALSRMPQALESLAVWPVISGLIFMFRSFGIAFNEVVVALLDKPRSSGSLRRFTGLLALLTTLGLSLITMTPLAGIWFSKISALSPELTDLARSGLWLALPMPAMATLQSWYQGAILHGRRTRGISEAVAVYLASFGLVAGFGVYWGKITGLYAGLAAMGIGMAVQTAWLWYRSRPIMQVVRQRDQGDLPVSTIGAATG